MAKVFEGDFIGFSFNNRHSSEFNIKRVSDGSRFSENLLPTLQDKTAQVTGGDGTYYWDTSYTQKPFPISFAFDNLSEEKFRKLRQWLGVKELCPLIFDETPYKVYTVKVTGTPNLKYICFDKETDEDSEIDLISTEDLNGSYVQGAKSNQRVYKGEGTIQFTAYYPYARSQYKIKEEYENEGYPNVDEWIETSGILTTDEYTSYDTVGSDINLYNPGDLETDFILYFDFVDNDNYENTKINSLSEISLVHNGSNTTKQTLKFKTDAPFLNKGTDRGFRINTKNNLIEGIAEDNSLSGNLYNEYFLTGDFFKIPLCLREEVGDGIYRPIYLLRITGATPTKIEYNYIYY